MKYTLWALPHQSRQNCIQAVRDAPDGYSVQIEPPAKKKTLKQGGAMFGLAYEIIMEYSGLQGSKDKEDLHEYWCGQFFGWVDKEIMGRTKWTPRRTTTKDENGKADPISTVQMAEMYDFIQRECAELGLIIPDPDPMYKRVNDQ